MVLWDARADAPEREDIVLMTVRMQGCMSEGTGAGFGSVPITYRVLGFTHRTTVYLPESVDIVAGPDEACH
jgi:hypothetical protein